MSIILLVGCCIYMLVGIFFSIIIYRDIKEIAKWDKDLYDSGYRKGYRHGIMDFTKKEGGGSK